MAHPAPAPEVTARVRAADAKGRDARDAGAEAHVNVFADEQRRVAGVLDVGVDMPQVDIAGANRAIQHQDAFCDAADACACLHVAKVCFGARHDDRIFATVLHDVPQRTDLDGIAQRRAGAVALRDGDLARRQPSLHHRAPDACLLRRPVRRSHARAAPVLVDVAADDARQHQLRILILATPLQERATAALAAQEAVGGLIKGEGAATSGQHLRLAVRDERVEAIVKAEAHDNCLVDVGVGGSCQLALVPHDHGAMRLAEGDQRRGASGVDGEAGALHVHQVRQPACADANRPSVVDLWVQCPITYSGVELRDSTLARPVRARVTDVEPAHHAACAPPIVACGMHGQVPHLQDVALAGTHCIGLVERYTEEVIVEGLDEGFLDSGEVVCVHETSSIGTVEGTVVEPRARDLVGAVTTHGPHAPALRRAVAGTAVAHLERGDVHPLAQLRGRQLDDPLLGRVGLRRRRHVPRLEQQAVAGGLVGVGHQVWHEHHDLAARERDAGADRIGSPRGGIEPEVAALAVHDVHREHLAALDEVHVRVHASTWLVVVLRHLPGPQLYLLALRVLRPDLARLAPPDGEAQVLLRVGHHELAEACELAVQLPQAILGLLVQVIQVQVRVLRGVVMAHALHLEVLGREPPVHDVQRLERRLLARRVGREHLDDAPSSLRQEPGDFACDRLGVHGP
mmetsp:Transcript_28691/g.72615  ORF Transcript_28691/g.72615 Transcript_28691/m.72615 type:complete len:685 (+) Transcript_28691:876-2930(+)